MVLTENGNEAVAKPRLLLNLDQQPARGNISSWTMAQKAKKDRAKANAASLKQLHLGTIFINAVFLLFVVFVGRRSLWLYILLSLPGLLAEAVLERTGRPRYDSVTHTLKASGEDLGAPGLMEYLFDVVWVTWICLVLVLLLGDKGWVFFLVVPAYGLYKGAGLLSMARGMMGMGGQPSRPSSDDPREGGMGREVLRRRKVAS